MLREHHPDAEVTAIEINGELIELVHAKGHEAEQGDFLKHEGPYEACVMNPPFEKGESYYLLCVEDASSSGLSCDCGLFFHDRDAGLLYQVYIGGLVRYGARKSQIDPT